MNSLQISRILLVEDDPADSALLQTYLRQSGIGSGEKGFLRMATTLAEALEQARNELPGLVLLDLSLPDSFGLQTVEQVRRLLPNTPIVVLTGNDDADLAVAALQAGAQDYLVKGNFDTDALARAVRHAVVREGLETRLRLMETALVATPNAVVITDVEAKIEWVNPAFCRLTGYSLEEALGKKPKELIKSGKQGSSFYQQMWKTILSGNEWRGEVVNKRKDGEYYHEELAITPVIDQLGTIIHFVAVKHDISERKNTELALRVAATAFQSQEAILVTGADCIIQQVNRAFVEATGYSAEEAIGQTPSLLCSGRHDDEFYKTMWHSLNEKGFWQGEIWNRRKNGEIYPEWLTITSVKDNDGEVTHYVGNFLDITTRKNTEDQIRSLAFFDPLTHLPNRRLLLDRLHQAVISRNRNQRYGALLFIDLDDFKSINDTLGHDTGDLLLIEAATRLQTCIREEDTVARLGGDEFVVILEYLSSQQQEAVSQSEIVAEKIIAKLNQPYQLKQHECHSTPSIGITLFWNNSDTVEDLLKHADLAMYQAKASGRNTLRFYDPVMQDAAHARSSLENDLRRGLANHEFLLYFQPQTDSSGQLIGAEALVRWQRPGHDLVLPGAFIPLAEETGLIQPLGQQIFQLACQQLANWSQEPESAGLTLAVNISASEFNHPGFVAQVRRIIEESGANPHRLKIELTESLLVNNIENAIIKMKELKELGLRFSLDDFGTGYSSLSYLKRLPLDQLKIDQSFIRDIISNASDAVIVQTIIGMANNFGLEVIAEGVENEDQRQFLKRHGCPFFQGYLFSHPLPIAEFDAVRRDLDDEQRSPDVEE